MALKAKKARPPSKIAPRFFNTSNDLRVWFSKNHDKVKELWIGFYKKGSKKKAIGYKEALDEALCFGWIDGVKNSVDEISYTNRFTPRKPKSNWSKINTAHVERLIKAGQMMPSGFKEVENAKKDGRWTSAYDSPKTASVPDDLLQELSKHKKAKAFFATLEKKNVYAIIYRLQNAKKPETRDKWLHRIVEMLNKGETFHS